MKASSFIIASKDYLISTGVNFLVNQIKNATVIDNVDCFDDILHSLEDKKPDFLIIASNFGKLSKEFLIKASSFTDIIGLEVPSHKLKYKEHYKLIFNLFDEKNKIVEQLISAVDEKGKSKNDTEESLSIRETDVLKQVALGFTNKEIAERLFISQHTVITHRKNITQKLGIKTISGLTVYAILNNIVSMEEVE